MQSAIRTIYDEHRSMSAVLSALESLAGMACDHRVRPDFKVFRAMLYYIDAFPERAHHPKENEHLFARLLARDPSARPLIEELGAEHAQGARLIRDLEHELLALEQAWPEGARTFEASVKAYAQFHWNHMRKEEQQLLPLAEKAFTEADWKDMATAFSGNDDPIADLREKDFAQLFSRIVSLAPSPIGLGEPWKKGAAA